MNNKNENFTPRERVDAQFLERLLSECDGIPCSAAASAAPVNSGPSCCRTPQPRRQTYPECRNGERGKGGRSLAMVYSPEQEFSDLYEAEEGLYRGTIFVQLDKPLREGCSREGRWRS